MAVSVDRHSGLRLVHDSERVDGETTSTATSIQEERSQLRRNPIEVFSAKRGNYSKNDLRTWPDSGKHLP